MSRFRSNIVIFAIAVAAANASDARAASETSTIAATVVGGVVVLRGELRTSSGAKVPAHFVLDLGSTDGLSLPEDQLAAFGLRAGDRATVQLDGERLENVIVTEAARAEVVRPLTADHATELMQVPAIGLIGVGALGPRPIQLDLAANVLRVGVPASTAALHTASPVTLPLEIDRGALTFKIGDLRVSVGTLQFESLISRALVSRLKQTSTTAPTVRLGATDLTAVDAYRPVADVFTDLQLGVRLLSHFRTTLDVTGRTITFETLTPPSAIADEQAYFLADDRSDADGIARFLEKSPDGRLATEAAMRLLELRIASRDADAISRAIAALAQSFPLPRRAHRMVLLVDQMLGRPDGAKFDAVARQMLDAASSSASDDLDGRAIFEIHARRGLLALRMGDLSAARRSLISAAYGMPADPQVNTWLGDLYRREREPLRAWARYVDASLGDAPLPAALRGLDALVAEPRFPRTVSPTDMELMLEGRVPSFDAGVVVSDTTPAAPARLVELFVNDGAPGCVGAQLAFEAYARSRSDGTTAFLSYHIGPAGNSALSVDRARRYGITALPAVVVDGTLVPAIEAAGADNARDLYQALTTRLEQRATTQPADSRPAASVGLSAEWKDDRIEGRVEVIGGPPPEHVELIVLLREPRVFAIGGDGLATHADVARIQLDATTSVGGWTFGGATSDVRRKVLTQGEQARALHALARPSMKTVAPRLGTCDVVALLQDAATHRVLAAATTQPTGKASGS